MALSVTPSFATRTSPSRAPYRFFEGPFRVLSRFPPCVGFGRIAVSERDILNLFENLVEIKEKMRPNPTSTALPRQLRQGSRADRSRATARAGNVFGCSAPVAPMQKHCGKPIY